MYLKKDYLSKAEAAKFCGIEFDKFIRFIIRTTHAIPVKFMGVRVWRRCDLQRHLDTVKPELDDITKY